MGRQNNFLKYNISGEIIEIIIRDSSGGKLESFKYNIKDKKREYSIFKLLRNKYNILPKQMKDKDLEWLD